MPGYVALPYLTASADHIRSVTWTDGNGDPLPAELKGWDPTTDIEVSVQIELDSAAVLDDCRLSANLDELSLVGVWRSAGTSIRGQGEKLSISRSYSAEDHRIDFQIPGREVMESVHVTVALTVPEMVPKREPMGAWRPGSVLWSDTRQIQVGGRGGRFPTEWTDFTASGQFHPEAGWQLDWNPEDLDAPTMAALRLYLNQKSSRMVETVSEAATDTSSELAEFLHFDIARTLLTGALSNSEFGTREFETETLGATLTRLHTAIFPGESPDQTRSRLRESPARFESELQGRLRLLKERSS